ncbi:unnamed protein product [Callosobruchus maculatus]|uniref:Uncharacterized protein n=1 Tax=Callosobruchus maculatus TaxID=64391 RepID=A0A653D2Z6_CALMS|nr:unnamed protein product [Callosobruchus maculatus]
MMNLKEKTIPGPKMNATNLYVTTTQIIMKSDPKNPNSWQDLYRLVPYLRNSLCCVVCSNLLVDPLTPTIAQCQHHLCRSCKGGRKKIKPACEGCKECNDYTDNKRLRILLQCYKKMCISLINSPLFHSINVQASHPGNGFERGAGNLILLIKEGACFEDEYTSNGGLPKSAYSILPCVYTNSTITQNNQSQPTNSDNKKALLNSNVQNRSFYSVLYPGNGSKITLKRKQKDCATSSTKSHPGAARQKEFTENALFKKPFTVKPKKGCRCGNATATPGKLTCCGQRCPCYVDSKACLECKCRGCRNPHRVDGQKGEYGKFCCNKPEIKMETTPAACGEAIEVPFINWEYLNVKLGTEVMAPPGAHIWTPTPPSIVGPLEDHVYGEPERRFEVRYTHRHKKRST